MRVPVSRAPAPRRALVALLLAWLLLVWPLAACTAGREGAGGGERPSARGPFGDPPRIADGAGLPGWVVEADFDASAGGFALLAECVNDPARPENGFCRQRVAVHDPAAGRWEPRASPLPELRGTEGASARLWVLGPGRALIEDGGGDEPLRDWFTGDGGRSWRAVDPRPAGRTPDIPEGAVLTAECAGAPGTAPERCAGERLVVLSPRDGRRRELVAQPPLGPHPRPARTAEPDGSWWASGILPGTGRTAVAVSRDAGRSWAVSPLPGPAGPPSRSVRVVVGPDAAYAAETGAPDGRGQVLNPLRALHRSLDGGRTWERTWTGDGRREPRSLEGVPVPGPGARVEVPGQWSGHRSPDGGRTFRKLSDGTAYVRRTAAGLLREGPRCRYALTRDGVRWTDFLLACGDDAGAGVPWS
ncbi:exo-alpha-sialidase [Streptomyces griseus]|uniref:exo-alpha-sialidase n=1 Tax=Streptomyces griseus TaxID=1911 RepID=UPI000A96D51B|nr:exo-alpha-sialidase [Streptomyces griseus]